ncbi:hypothetical protein NESM_000563200 [Novymonas esmeraldas]|uniref:Uncharacterized protein n=1 Tax=Novymonas esmeraldas TaxID=1808958 RepID=A0AAW0ETI6_9TRYP
MSDESSPLGTAENVPAYTRDALEKELRDGFRKQQQRVNKDRQVEQLALAKGLGGPAVASLKDGFYSPRKVLPPLKPEEKKLFERMDFKNWRRGTDRKLEDAAEVRQPALDACTPESASSTPTTTTAVVVGAGGGRSGDALNTSVSSTTSSLAALKGNCAEDVRDFLHQLRSTTRATASVHDARAEVEDNIQIVEAALSQQCAPLSFSELLDTTSRVLSAMERGELAEDVVVPCGADVPQPPAEDGPDVLPAAASAGGLAPEAAPDPPPTIDTTRVLHGAVEVEAYTRAHLLPRAYRAVAIAHTAEWMLQYTMAYLRTTAAANQDEALTRLQLLARCVRLLGDMENFSSVLLTLEAKCEEYAGFVALREMAENHIGTLLSEVESSLDAVLGVPFPSRRARLLLIERGIQKKLQRALLFLNEIDYSWTPHVHFHWSWKLELLSTSFRRIHGPIAEKYMRCSMGFVDDSLYEQVADTRITGRYMGATPVQPKVSRAQQVEYERVTEGLTLQQLGMSVKGLASLVVGEQVCMSARYILRQSTKEFNAVWGFRMDEVSAAPTEAQLSETVAKMAARAKQKYMARAGAEKMQPSLTFLTEM